MIFVKKNSSTLINMSQVFVVSVHKEYLSGGKVGYKCGGYDTKGAEVCVFGTYETEDEALNKLNELYKCLDNANNSVIISTA